MKHAPVMALLFFILSAPLSCSLPRHVWPQKDIAPYVLNSPLAEKRVLVASRSSTFKEAVLARVAGAFEGEPVYLKTVGIGQLEQEMGSDYQVVVIMSSCIAWGIDPLVESFLEQNRSRENIIILTTSADGDWLPDLKGRNVDAISSASEKTDIDGIAQKLIGKIRFRFN